MIYQDTTDPTTRDPKKSIQQQWTQDNGSNDNGYNDYGYNNNGTNNNGSRSVFNDNGSWLNGEDSLMMIHCGSGGFSWLLADKRSTLKGPTYYGVLGLDLEDTVKKTSIDFLSESTRGEFYACKQRFG